MFFKWLLTNQVEECLAEWTCLPKDLESTDNLIEEYIKKEQYDLINKNNPRFLKVLLRLMSNKLAIIFMN